MEARRRSRQPAGWWADRSIRTKGLVVLCVPILILLAVLGSISWFARVNDRAQAIGSSDREALGLTRTVDAEMLAADSGVRGYLLTGDPSLLATYHSAEGSTPRLLRQLERLATRTSSEQRAVSGLMPATAQLSSDLRQLAAMSPSVSSAQVEAMTRTSQFDTDRFGTAVTSLTHALNSDSSAQHNTIHLSYVYLLAITIAGALLALCGGVALTQLFTSGVTTRLRRLERATAALEKGEAELPPDAPAGKDEIGRLSARLSSAASQLRDRAHERDGARRQLEDILTTSPVVSLRYDVEGRRFSYASPNVHRLLGIQPADALEDPSSVIRRFHPEDAKRLAKVLVEALQEHTSQKAASPASETGSDDGSGIGSGAGSAAGSGAGGASDGYGAGGAYDGYGAGGASDGYGAVSAAGSAAGFGAGGASDGGPSGVPRPTGGPAESGIAAASPAVVRRDDVDRRNDNETPKRRFEITLRFRRDPTSNRWGEAEAIYTLEFGPEGQLAGVVAYLVDASERHSALRAADERRSMLETIFHASPDTIVVRDVVGRIILASSTLADVIGVGQRTVDRSGEYVDASSRIATVSARDRELLDSLAARCLAGEPTPDPVITTSAFPSGDVCTYETRARAVLDHDGHVIGTVTVSRDITDRTRLEHSLREASDAAARASEAKSEFLSRMSHELRTPLNAILGFAQLLELDELEEDQSSSVGQIQRAGHHLLSLINEVLDISRIEAGRLSLSADSVQVGDVLDEVTSLLSPTAESAGIQLTIAAEGAREVCVRADRQRLLQVLLNLGSNAVKYNQRGGSVAFRTFCSQAGKVRFEVRDTGPGIASEQQDQLFLPFSRLGAELSGVEGTGVGLALSKQLVELMGGSIGIDSRIGHGATFWVELIAADSSTKAERGRPKGGFLELEDANGDEVSGTGSGPSDESLGSVIEVNGKRSSRRTPAANGKPAAPVTGGEPGGPASNWNSGKASTDATEEASDGSPVTANATAEVTDRVTRVDGAGDGREREVVILQIEDNPSNASLVEQVLARRSEVRLVTSPEASTGLAKARELQPDLILLDLHLPDMPGEEVLYRLKAEPDLGTVKVVVVSADATPRRIRRMLELGVEGYLTKPVDVEALLRLVDLEIADMKGGR